MYPLLLPDSRLAHLPTAWPELTLAQAVGVASLPDGSDVFDMLALLAGCSPFDIIALPLDQTSGLIDATAFLMTEPDDFSAWPAPPAVTIGGREVVVPQRLEVSSFGQAVDMGDLLGNSALSMHEKRRRALAIYLYPLYHGTAYDTDGMEAFEQLCGAVPLAFALPITDFFLRSTTVSAAPTSAGSSPFLPTPPKEPQGWRSWFESGIQWPLWMRWPKATKRSGTTSSG